MFPFGARVVTRHGTLGTIVRGLTNHPPYQYLLVTFGGKARIFFHDDLSLLAGADRWPITDKPRSGVERRTGQRRQHRHDEQNRTEVVTADRRVADRRQAERRWI